ncbi:MAG: iron ABC transporter permease [Sphaerochaetaceae bacterium]|nr:iron ABC transporter permease [Sphaerochaetaceae bacterium]
MSRVYSIEENGSETNRVKKFFQKDFSQLIIFAIPMVFLAVFLLYPLASTLIRAFWAPSEGLEFSGWSLEGFRQFLESNMYRKSLYNSFVISIAVTFFTLLIGVPMGYCVARVKMPCKTLILSLGILPIIMPSFVGAYTWVILLGNKGIVRIFLNWLLKPFGVTVPSIYGMFGMILCMTLTYYPFVFQLSYGAFAGANALLEESAMLMGAKKGRIMRTITFPLIMPSLGAAALLVFVRAIGNFGIPAVIGGNNYVLPTLIYFEMNGFWNINGASSIAVVNVAITALVLYIQKYVVARHEYETISATHTDVKLHESTGAKVFATVFCLIILVMSLLPQLTIIVMSFFKRWDGLLPTGFTFEYYTRIPRYSHKEMFNSFFLSITATLLCAVLGSIVAYITERKKPKGAALLDLSLMAPFILPGTVVSIALLSAFSGSSAIRLTGTYVIIIISYMIRRTPYVYRSVCASLTQLNPSLEEASTISGATWFYTFRRVSVPLILPAIISGSILTLTTLLQELSTTILLYAGNTRTVPIQIYSAVQNGKLGQASALSVILLVVVFAIIYAMNRRKGGDMSSSFKM